MAVGRIVNGRRLSYCVHRIRHAEGARPALTPPPLPCVCRSLWTRSHWRLLQIRQVLSATSATVVNHANKVAAFVVAFAIFKDALNWVRNTPDLLPSYYLACPYKVLA